MLSTGIPELKCAGDIEYLRKALLLDKGKESDGRAHFEKLIYQSLSSFATQFNNMVGSGMCLTRFNLC